MALTHFIDGVKVYDSATTPEGQNETTMRTQADAALADLRLVASSSGTLTGAQLSNAVRVIARVVIALVRLQLRRLDGVD